MEPEITPTDLKFRFQIAKQLPGSITIHNPGSERLAFKVKTTTPKKYVVRPSSGIVEPKTTANVQVIMQAQKEFPADFNNCKDKFLVQTVTLQDTEELTQDTFKREGHKDTKIRVVLEGPPAPPSPVPEMNETEDESTKSEKHDMAPAVAVPAPLRMMDEPSALSQENKQLRAQVERLQAERDELRRKLQSGPPAAVASRGAQSAVSPLSLLPVLLVAIIAFILGHFLKDRLPFGKA